MGSRIAAYLGEDDGRNFLTVEECGHDFISALADATQTTVDWDDLKVMKSGASNKLNGLAVNGPTYEKGRAATNSHSLRKEGPFASEEIKADPSSSKKRKKNPLSEQTCDNFSTGDSDFEMDNHHARSFSVQTKTHSRNAELQCRSSDNSKDARWAPWRSPTSLHHGPMVAGCSTGMDSLLGLAVSCGFDRDIATACLARLIELYGEDGRHLLTVERCGDDFISALADATKTGEDWDDPRVIQERSF